jgi:hypothetical protein
MAHVVEFENVSTTGLESSPVASALAGLRANEARYFWNKYRHQFTVMPARDSRATLDEVNRIPADERGLVITSRPLETARFQVEDLKLAMGMEVPMELEGRFKFARQKSKLAGVIRGSFFVIKKEHG